MKVAPALVFLIVLLAAPTARAQLASEPSPAAFTFGPSIGTLGAGLEGGWRASPYLGLRLDGSALSLNVNRTIDTIPYRFGVKLRSGGPLIDFYPFPGAFRVSAGVRYNGNESDVTSTPASNVTIGGTTFTPGEVGTLSGKVAYNRVAPYLGVGFAADVAPWFELGFDAGVLYQGKPRVSLSASGSFAGTPALETALDQERHSIQSKIGWTQWYPAVTLAALLRF